MSQADENRELDKIYAEAARKEKESVKLVISSVLNAVESGQGVVKAITPRLFNYRELTKCRREKLKADSNRLLRKYIHDRNKLTIAQLNVRRLTALVKELQGE